MTRTLLAVLLWLAAHVCVAQVADAPANADTALQQVLVLLNLPPEHFRPDASYSGGYGGGTGHGARRGVAARLAHEHGLTLVGDWPMPLLGVDCYVMQLAPGRTREAAIEALSRDARVAWAQPMNVYRGQGARIDTTPTHNDPLYRTQPAAQAWRLADLHELATGRGVRVAVVDSGVAQRHPDLAGQLDVAENFVDGRPYADERHGTAVAGIIGARADNGIGIAGVAPQARLLALRACWQASRDDTLCTTLGLAKALHFAITQRADIVNLSLSGPQDRLLAQLIDAAQSRGITVVAAFDAILPGGGFPASHAGVWAVTDDASRARPPVLQAPGRDVPSTVPGDAWQTVSGASYAAAHVAGLAALMRELGASHSPALQLASMALLASGSIDTCATLLRVVGPRVCSCAIERSRSVATPATGPDSSHP